MKKNRCEHNLCDYVKKTHPEFTKNRSLMTNSVKELVLAGYFKMFICLRHKYCQCN